MKRVFPIFFMLTTLNLHCQSQIMIGSTLVEVDTIYTGLDIPWEIIYGPDGKIWTTERKGIVSRIDPVNNTKQVILNIESTVFQIGESGLLGMALNPDFANSPYVYLVYTYGSSTSNMKERVVRYTFNGTNLISPQILLDNITAYSSHDGSRLCILSDNTLLISTGDAQNTDFPQNVNSLNGKILRINLDGSIPNDNPLNENPVYSYGHRNVQGILKHPNGKVYLSEHGPTTNDEFQLLESGCNYGWPDVEGFCDQKDEISFCNDNNVKEPIKVWTPTIAPSDMVFYINNEFPEFNGRVLMTTLKDKRIVAMKLNSSGTQVEDEDHYLAGTFGRLRDICIGPSKEIYIATNGSSASNTKPGTHSIIRLRVSKDSGFEKLKQPDFFSIFPNPTEGNVTIQIDHNIDQGEILIQSASGQLINEISLSGKQEITFDLPESANLYFITVRTEMGVNTKLCVRN